MIRAILDTNVIINGFINKNGAPGEILKILYPAILIPKRPQPQRYYTPRLLYLSSQSSTIRRVFNTVAKSLLKNFSFLSTFWLRDRGVTPNTKQLIR